IPLPLHDFVDTEARPGARGGRGGQATVVGTRIEEEILQGIQSTCGGQLGRDSIDQVTLARNLFVDAAAGESRPRVDALAIALAVVRVHGLAAGGTELEQLVSGPTLESLFPGLPGRLERLVAGIFAPFGDALLEHGGGIVELAVVPFGAECRRFEQLALAERSGDLGRRAAVDERFDVTAAAQRARTPLGEGASTGPRACST